MKKKGGGEAGGNKGKKRSSLVVQGKPVTRKRKIGRVWRNTCRKMKSEIMSVPG